MTTPRRPFLLGAGEQLLLSHDALTSVSRFLEFLNLTGLEAEDVVGEPCVSVPLPVCYRAGRFPDVAAEMMWLPLFWLPESIGLRLLVREEGEAEPRVETDTEWAVRVALELQGSGLYIADEGWVDVLAVHGMDIDNPVDIARLEAWQKGATDETLDSIDLSGMFAGGDEWAFHEAAEMLPILQPAQWCATAGSLLNALDDYPLEELGGLAAVGGQLLELEPSTAPDILMDAAEALGAGADAAEWSEQVRGALTAVVDEYAEALHALGS